MSRSRGFFSRTGPVLLSSFVLIVWAALPAYAATHKRCNDYANEAYWRGMYAVKFKCGFKGPRWSSKYKTHYDWCRGVKSEVHLKNERKIRQNKLGKCMSKKGGTPGKPKPAPGKPKPAPAAKKQACNLYAHMAINHQHQNLNRRCGHKGARWSANWQHHNGWCMKVSAAMSNAESKARQKALKACKPKKPFPPVPMPVKPTPAKPAPAAPWTGPGPVSPTPSPAVPGTTGPGIITPPSTGDAAVEWDTNRPGLDYRDFWLSEPLPAHCRRACNQEAQCRAWTFVKPGLQGPQAKCWLKSGVPPKAQDTCCVSGVRGGAQATGIPAAGAKTFVNPSVEGYRVDWCQTLGVGCGKPAADAFCRLQGLTQSTSHVVARHIGAQSPTRTLGAGEICNAPECDGFKSITCQ